ncbi:MAG: hypothetical protein HY547_06525 [Elusimicrobia bacterium]|nr:hypothetical protein [Elusimicrobiota bacterium]
MPGNKTSYPHSLFALRSSLFALSCSLLISCRSLPKSASKPDVNFSIIKNVQINAKDNISPIVARELLLAGISPRVHVGEDLNVDAILKVTTTAQNPEKRYIVKTSKRQLTQTTSVTGSSDQIASSVEYIEDPGHSPVEVSGTQPFVQSVWGAADAQMIGTYAQVFLSGELISPQDGSILWAGGYTYEGIDLQGAIEGAVRGLVRELPIGRNQ